ncbi:MAG: DUF3343 domain-containing protein [Clostridia bacterium]|nr:DUF3343 domain-containing protein [Clostridia bacterium]
MTRIRIAIGSVTYGEKGMAALRARGVPVRLVRLDPRQSRGGCAYALEILGGGYTVPGIRQMLHEAHVRYTEILEDALPML